MSAETEIKMNATKHKERKKTMLANLDILLYSTSGLKEILIVAVNIENQQLHLKHLEASETPQTTK